ncbi:MAG: hypothetical protein C0497_11510 [Gemmatimonas sp.]|nr:hypothetical protein [Gemmatimonas sp.]
MLLAVDSRERTWDFAGGIFGPDIAFIDTALADTFSRYRIDAQRMEIGEVSDGATMSLAVGLSNGDLFSHVDAWTPGALIDTKHPAASPLCSSPTARRTRSFLADRTPG